MGNIVYLEHYRSFREASTRAKAVAAKQRKGTQVSRDADRWRVSVAASNFLPYAAADLAHDNSDRYSDEMYEAFAAQKCRDEVYEEIMDEIEMERDDWARSNEDGWFYDDNDPD